MRKEVAGQLKNRKMFNCLFQKSGEAYKLYVNDVIERKDWNGERAETSATYFAEKLAEIPEGAELEIHINSEGGDAYEGTAIYNMLKAANVHKTGIVDGRAFSAATFILMACDDRVMNTGTNLLVHNAWTFAVGNADDLRAAANDLDKLMETNRKIYLERCTMSEEELIALMKEDRLLTPEESLEYGFIDRIGAKAEEPEEEPEAELEEAPEEPQEEPDNDEPEEEAQALRPDRYAAAERFFKQFY